MTAPGPRPWTSMKKLIKDEARKMHAWSFDEIERDNVKAIETMKASGTTFDMTPDRASFMKNIDAFYTKYEGQPWYDKALVQKLTKK